MEQELFDTLSALEMQADKERLQQGETEIMDYEAAKYVSLLAVSQQAKSIVEVGSGIGYSTLWLAYAASITGGKVVTCELDPAKAEQTQANLQKADLADYVEVLTGDARELFRHRDEAVDFLLIDADYGQYETYFDVLYKRMQLGSTIVAADVIEAENDLADYTTYAQNHPNLESVTIPLGQGLEFTVKTMD